MDTTTTPQVQTLAQTPTTPQPVQAGAIQTGTNYAGNTPLQPASTTQATQQQTAQQSTGPVASDGTQLDPSVVALAQSIRSVESDNNYNAHGSSGEFGAYQFMPNTWKQDAQAYLGDPNAPMTPVNQDKVAYSSMKSMKDAGYSPEEIASTWNSGKPNWIGNVGTNQFGVKYDTPTYVNSVIQKYSEIKSGIQNGQTQPTDSTVQVPEQAPSVGGFIENAAGSTVNLIGNLGNALMHPIDTLSNLAGTVAGAGESAAD